MVCRRHRVHPWRGKIPWRREWQPTPVFLSGKCHGRRILAGYSAWGHKKSDRTWKLVVNHFINKRKSLGLAPGSVSFSCYMWSELHEPWISYSPVCSLMYMSREGSAPMGKTQIHSQLVLISKQRLCHTLSILTTSGMGDPFPEWLLSLSMETLFEKVTAYSYRTHLRPTAWS